WWPRKGSGCSRSGRNARPWSWCSGIWKNRSSPRRSIAQSIFNRFLEISPLREPSLPRGFSAQEFVEEHGLVQMGLDHGTAVFQQLLQFGVPRFLGGLIDPLQHLLVRGDFMFDIGSVEGEAAGV